MNSRSGRRAPRIATNAGRARQTVSAIQQADVPLDERRLSTLARIRPRPFGCAAKLAGLGLGARHRQGREPPLIMRAMGYYADLTPFTYSRTEADPAILNVGWLSGKVAFPTAQPHSEFVRALTKLTATPINLYHGTHLCDLCPPPSSRASAAGLGMAGDQAEARGNGEIWVKGEDGLTYGAPTLILHYVVEHHYSPPAGFVQAVLKTA